MIIVAVTFTISAEISPKALKEKFLETALICKEALGLIRKIISAI